LESNGRVESDLLDRLQEALKASSASKNINAARVSGSPPAKSAAPAIDAPVPQLPDHPALAAGLNKDQANLQDGQLQEEAKSLENILRNQSHPTNLIAVKRDNTQVVQSPIADAKVLFLASAEDEFEVLDENPAWVHVRISGLARGWLRRSAVEMPGDSKAPPGDEMTVVPAQKAAGTDRQQLPAAFSVSSEEIGSFPGDWAPLHGNNVKIITLQQAPSIGRITSPQEKKQFAEILLKRESSSLPADDAGLVLVFDSEDGGMVAATRSALKQWNTGMLSEAAFWKQCFLDPPEILGTN
jgi:hypothetical protein